MAAKKGRKVTKRGLVKKLDQVFSLWIRTKYSHNGLCYCYTCDKIGAIKEMHCGHFISRTHYSTRWDENNCRVQCPACNLYHQGEQYKFGTKLEKEIGTSRMEELLQKRYHPARYSVQDYLDMIERYGYAINHSHKGRRSRPAQRP